MKKFLSALIIATLSIPMTGALSTADAGDGGRIAAGVAGGFLGGLVLGGALAPRPRPAPEYYSAGPVYYDAPHCYWTMGEPYWDGYYGVWRHPRVRACD